MIITFCRDHGSKKDAAQCAVVVFAVGVAVITAFTDTFARVSQSANERERREGERERERERERNSHKDFSYR